MEEIKPKYVTFEQAKLLKEKGFNLPCFYYYENDKLIEPYLENGSSTDTEFKVELSDLLEHFNKWSKRISVPEQWQVVEWLRVNHGIWVWVEKGRNPENFYPVIDSGKEIASFKYLPKMWRDTPQEVYSAAFDYILKELI